jgi:hypothetical protein
MAEISVHQLHQETRRKLKLTWVAGKSGGDNLKEFLVNLPQFHNHIMLMYPKLTPPEFKVCDINENDIVVHYMSKRPGLQEFVRGLFSGLGKLYKTTVTIDLLQSRNDGSEHEAFKISW